MTYRRHTNRNDFNHSKQQITATMLRWTLMFVMVFQQLKTTAAAKFKGDNCFTKDQPGVCKEWGECPIIKTLIESGEYTNREVVSCGFGVREELICCPVRAETKIETGTDANNDRSGNRITTTTPPPARDFWLDLLKNTTSVTTAAPDFWLELLKPTAATTLKPLIIGEQKLNESSEFFDFNALLGGKKNSASQQRPTAGADQAPANNENGRGNNLNTGPVNVNQWSFSPSANNFNNGRGNQFANPGNANFAWNQQNNNGRGSMNGHFNLQRGLNNGRAHHIQFNNGREPPHNNGRVHSIWGRENLSQGFTSPENNIRPNHLPSDQSQDQTHNSELSNTDTGKSEDKGIDDLINYIFTNSEFEEDDPMLSKAQNPFFNTPQNLNIPQPVVWLTPQSNANTNSEIQFVHVPTINHQQEFQNPQATGQFETTPLAARLANGPHQASSANFIQQPVETWPPNTDPSQTFNPVQAIHDNSVHSGIEIVRAQQVQVQPTLNQPHVVVVQSPVPMQQPPQIIYQQHNFGDHLESMAKGTRSTAPLLIVQSPPRQALDPFKPFEFRPPPTEENTFSEDNNSLSPNPSTKPDTKPGADRPTVRACRRIEKNLPASLSPHILDGTPAALGEFPHMAGIGYSRIGGDNRPPYDIRCGGTLIDKRFVLTAAHCVSEIENVPSIVRLGVVDFKDTEQMKEAVEIPIKQTHIHEEYRTRLTYNDIAILELERDVVYSEYIYPVCLYTDLKDPDTEIKLWVTGWGTINTTTRSYSDLLLKAPLHTSPLKNCNKSFTDYGLNRRIPEGIIRTQFCAEDKDQTKDACQGDSGGPLNLVVDESYKNYRLVGIVSSGFGCASSTPGLYTRVAAFLDFIEKIVWPHGGD